MNPHFFSLLVGAWLAIAVATFVLLQFVSAPYGRHARGGWGPQIKSRTGWLLMEAVSPSVVLAFFVTGERRDPVALAFLAMWLGHYANRAFIFPFRSRGGDKPMPLSVAVMAMFFNSVNGSLNGYWLFHIGPAYPLSWFLDPRFIVGALLFVSGFVINFQSDNILMRLRAPGETGYKIPVGGLYRYISSPNYFGEMVEWCGFALATWSLPGLTFAVWTIANLAPRALTNHRWYLEKFPDYPRGRRALNLLGAVLAQDAAARR